MGELFYKRLCWVLACVLCGVLFGGIARKLRHRSLPKADPVQSQLVSAGSFADHRTPVGGSASTAADAGASNSAQVSSVPPLPSAQEVHVVVVDAGGHPLEGVEVLLRQGFAPLGPNPGQNPKGRGPLELGVMHGPLPFPEEVIAGQVSSAGARAGGIGQKPGGTETSGVRVLRTDKQGQARFAEVTAGRWFLLAEFLGKSASAEIETAQSQTAENAHKTDLPFRVVLRLVPQAVCADALGNAGMAEMEGADALGSPAALSARKDKKGRVLDVRGFAVAQAQIAALVAGSQRFVSTDARGQFVLPLVPHGEVRLQVTKAGFAPLTKTIGSADWPEELALELRVGGGVSGQVEQGHGGGVPDGFSLSLVLQSGERWPLKVGSDGRFAQTGIPQGFVTLVGQARGFSPIRKTVQVPEGASPHEITVREVRLLLQKGAQLFGQVRQDGHSVQDAEVHAENDAHELVAKGRTDAHGEFSLLDVPEGTLTVTAQKQNHRTQTRITVRSAERQQIDLELLPF